MKSFSEISEIHDADTKLDNLGHPSKLGKSRLKQLTRPFPDFEDIDLDSWFGYPFPKNTSNQTLNELRYLISLGEFRHDWQKEMIMYDLDVIKPFKDYLEEYGLEVDFDRISNLLDQTFPIILALKRYYNRPRPQILAKEIGLDMTFFPLKTSKTPSYPSGHATQGCMVSKLVCDEVPLEHRTNILDIGKRIGESRQVAGAHYPTDTSFGIKLGEELYRLSKTRQEPELTLEMVESLEFDDGDEIEFAVDVVADIDKQISSINGDVSIDPRPKKTNSKRIGIQIILPGLQRAKFASLANSIVTGDKDLEKLDPVSDRMAKDFVILHKDLQRKIYVTTRPDGQRGGGAKADPNELMTAALCTMSSVPTVETIEDLDKLIEKVKEVIKTGKVIGYTSLEEESLEANYDNLLKGISAAEVIMKKGWNSANKVYLTGKAWSDDVKQFQMTKYGMKDFNASDFIIKKGDKFLGVSLKKKKSTNTGDPTLINKGFTTLLQGKQFNKVRDELDDASYMFYSGVIKTAQRFQELKPKIAMTDGVPWISKTLNDKLGKKAKNLTNKNWKKFVNGLPNELINYQLKKNKSIFKPMSKVIEDNADLFADTLLKLILKTELKELQKVNFDFALVTGIGRMLKGGLVIDKGDYTDVDTMVTKLDELFESGKPMMKLDPKKTQAFDSGSTAAMLHMILSVGSNPICDITLRYKGSFSSAPTFLATFSQEFKDSIK